MNRNDSLQLNLLRFPLMLGVILGHAHSLVGLPGAAKVEASHDQPVAMFSELLIFDLWAPTVALFFLFSGFLLYRQEAVNGSVWLSKLSNRFARLGVPYLIWNGTVFLLYWLGQSIPAFSPFFTKPEHAIANLDWWERANLLLGITRFPIDYQFWFIRDLLLLVAMSPLLWLAMRYIRVPALVVMFLFWSGLVNNPPLPVMPQALLFFAVGIALGQISGERLRIPQHAGYVLIFVLGTVVRTAVRTAVPEDRFPVALRLLYDFNVCVGVPAGWTVAGWLRQMPSAKRGLMYLKDYAFFLFASHEPLLMTVKKLAYSLVGYDTSTKLLAVYLAAACSVTLICVGTGILLNYLLPSVFQVLTGQGPMAVEPRAANEAENQPLGVPSA